MLGKKIEFQVADIRDQAGYRGRGRDPLHPRQQGDHADRRRQQRSVDRDGEARPARARRLHGRQQRLQRYHRQGLPALRLPRPALGLHGLQGARSRAGQGTRQEQESRLPDARLHLRSQRVRLDEGVYRQGRLDGRHQSTGAARHHRLLVLSPQHRQQRRRRLRQHRVRRRCGRPRPSRPNSSACCRR